MRQTTQGLIHRSVSIIIPVKNGASFLERAVNSALAQDPQEVIVVDNNSTDKTPSLLARLTGQHPSLIITSCSTPGASAARNHGLTLASGEWVQFLDADDELDQGKITAHLELTNAATDWIIGGYRNVYPNETVLDNTPHPDPWKGLVFRYRIGCTHANFFRRSRLISLGGWNENLPNLQDPDLHFRLLMQDTPYAIDFAVRCTYHHREEGQITKHDVVGGCRRRTELIGRVIDHLREEEPEYWQVNSPFFHGAYLRSARVLATHDLGAAAGAMENIDRRWKSWKQPELISPLLWQMYRLLDFKKVEALRLQMRKVLPAALKKLLK